MATCETANPALQLAAERERYAQQIAAAAGCRKRINGLKARLRKAGASRSTD